MEICSLCDHPLSGRKIMQENRLFCCYGCQTVYQILSVKGEQGQKNEHPLYKQAIHWGLISNPTIGKNPGLEPSAHSQKWVVEVSNLWCPSCADLIQLVLQEKIGLSSCFVDYMTDLATFIFDPMKIKREEIRSTIESLGYKMNELDKLGENAVQRDLIFRAAIGGFTSLNVMMFAYPLYATYFDMDLEGLQPLFAWLSFMLTLPVMIYSGFPLYYRMWNQITHGYLGMETLLGVGTLAALALSIEEIYKGTYHVYFDSITVLITFLLIGKILETKAKFSSKQALLRLNQSLPKRARKKMSETSFEFVSIKEIAIGDHLIAYSGEGVVLDGVVQSGEGICDESLLTGEVLPVIKKRGDALLGGSMIQSGSLIYSVTALVQHSTLSKILYLIEEGFLKKKVKKSLLQTIFLSFIPFVFISVFATFIFGFLLEHSFHESLRRGLSLLFIACPCAIGIAIPIVEARLINRFVEKGVIIRNRSIFSKIPKVTHCVFDKTGTLTEGNLHVIKGVDELEIPIQRILKGITACSTHPIAKSIHQVIAQGIILENVKEIMGAGLEAIYQNDVYLLGSFAFVKARGCNIEANLREQSSVYFCMNQRLLSEIILEDKIREDAVLLLRNLELYETWILSGDQEPVVAHLAKQLNIKNYKFEATPFEKQSWIQGLQKQGAVVLMVGDGINDAPALSQADVSVSVLSASDISIQVSDILLTQEKLTTILEVLNFSKKGYSLMQQNLFWAFIYNIVGMGLAFFGLMTPLFATFAMTVSSLFVILNARRI